MDEPINHKACVDLLMNEYGIPKQRRTEVYEEVVRIYHEVDMPHFVIIRSVRGFLSVPQTRSLESILDRLKTHPAKHGRASFTYREGAERSYEE